MSFSKKISKVQMVGLLGCTAMGMSVLAGIGIASAEGFPFRAPAAAPAAPAVDMRYLAIQPNDIVVGSPAAPVTIIEYSSMTCPHCADFIAEVMPSVKKEWIATGKAKFVYRDLAWDDLALGMAKVVRCAPPTQQMMLAEAFFMGQKDIMTGSNPLMGVKRIAMMAGMDGAKVEACVKDAKLHTVVLNEKDTAMEKLHVTGTPTFFVNGARVDGAVPYKDLKKTLDAEYAKAIGFKK